MCGTGRGNELHCRQIQQLVKRAQAGGAVALVLAACIEGVDIKRSTHAEADDIKIPVIIQFYF